MPPPFIIGRGAYGITLVRTYSTYVPNVPYVCKSRTKNGVRAISVDNTGALDSYFMYRYFHIQVYNHKIHVKFDKGLDQTIIKKVMALDLRVGFCSLS